MITVQFKDFDDMMAFAKQMCGVATVATRPEPQPEPAAVASSNDHTAGPDAEAESVTEDAAMEVTAAEPETVTLEEVRARLAALNKSGKRTEVKALLAGFGAVKLSEVPEDQYAALMEKAGEL